MVAHPFGNAPRGQHQDSTKGPLVAGAKCHPGNGRFIVRRKTKRMRLGTPVVLLLVFGESFRTAMDGTIVQKDLKIRII